MTTPLYQVDAFTDRPFAGNPAAVCLLSEPRDADWMQAVASEMNLSETAFPVPRARPEEGYDLRWFTPVAEVELCGHATLATAHVLWQSGRLERATPARFQTASGPLTAVARDGWIAMDFPSYEVEPQPAGAHEVAAALGAEPLFVGRSRFDLLVELGAEEAVRRLAPDTGRLAALDARGVIVTARASSPGFDFVSRFFAPRVGVPEDPVTGSAHCCLGPYWATKLGRRELTGYQASPRGGVVRLAVAPGGREGRVELAGRAVTVVEGALRDEAPGSFC